MSAAPPLPAWLPTDGTIARHFGRTLLTPTYKVVLAKWLSALLPSTGALSILDVGAGDGRLGGFFQEYRPETTVTGLETFVRVEDSPITLQSFNGQDFPFPDASWDVVLFANVLHHTSNQLELLRESVRVGRHSILIKDHIYRSPIGRLKLILLDLMGNLRFGVATTADYLPSEQWQRLFCQAGIAEALEYESIPLRKGLLRAAFENDLEVIFHLPLNQH
ncbi:MAG: class I SAM-dependent methyltransferase [Nitrospirota bacterium]